MMINSVYLTIAAVLDCLLVPNAFSSNLHLVRAWVLFVEAWGRMGGEIYYYRDLFKKISETRFDSCWNILPLFFFLSVVEYY